MNGMPPVQNALASESPVTYSGECPICIVKYGSWTVTTECGHKFCGSCFVSLVKFDNKKCPMCRGPLLSRIFTTGPTNPESVMRVNDRGIQTMGHSANADIT